MTRMESAFSGMTRIFFVSGMYLRSDGMRSDGMRLDGTRKQEDAVNLGSLMEKRMVKAILRSVVMISVTS